MKFHQLIAEVYELYREIDRSDENSNDNAQVTVADRSKFTTKTENVVKIENKKPSCRYDSRPYCMVVSDLKGHPRSMISISSEKAYATSYW